MAATQNFTVVKGDNFAADLLFKDAAGDPIDLTGISSCELNIAADYELTTSASASYSLGSGITVPDPTNGTIKVSTSTITLEADAYVYDFAYTLGGVKTTWLRGKFIVLPEVTP
jgi:hypothetical protein